MTWVFAASLDGRTAAPDGTSRWISSRAARQDLHRLRAAHDAVLVGSGTLRMDDPHLGVRHGVTGSAPTRVVLDAAATLLHAGSRVADSSAPTIVVVAPGADRRALPGGVAVLEVPVASDGRFDLARLLGDLRSGHGIRTLLLEGGATLAGACLEAGLVDRVVAYMAPAILGAGRAVVTLGGVGTIADMRRFRLREVKVIGSDIRISMVTRAG